MDAMIQELTDPVTLELLEDPVTLPCCGKSISRPTIKDCLGVYSTCPLCRCDLSALSFNPDTAPRNVAVAGMLDIVKLQIPSDQLPKGGHRWSARVECVSMDPAKPVAQLELKNTMTRFAPRPTVFIAVVDRSGSMQGNPWNQVEAALLHIYSLARSNPLVVLEIIAYQSVAEIIAIPTDEAKAIQCIKTMFTGGGTNFRGAFSKLQELFRKYSVLDVSSITVAFLTDGESGESDKKGLVATLASCCTACPRPLTVHAVGFGSSCDRELLEMIRTASKVHGTFRYAVPSDGVDALCNKLTSLFDLASQGSVVPLTITLPEGMSFAEASGKKDRTAEVQLTVANKEAIYKTWIEFTPDCLKALGVKASKDAVVVVTSAYDQKRPVPILYDATVRKEVLEQWLRKLLDDVASELLRLGNSSAKMKPNVRELLCALLVQRLAAVASVISDDRIVPLQNQIKSFVQSGSINVGQLSDMRFGSVFAGIPTTATNAAKPKVQAQQPTVLPTDLPQAPAKVTVYKEKPVRYSHNSEGLLRNPLQTQIMNLTRKGTPPAEVLALMKDVSNVTHKDRQGNTALHLAAYSGLVGTVKAIMAQHPTLDLSDLNQDNETPVTLAIKGRGFHETLCVLLENGGSIPRKKFLEQFAMDMKFPRTAAIISAFGEFTTEVDLSMAPDYVQFVYDQIQKKKLTFNVQNFLKVAMAKLLPRVVGDIITNHGGIVTVDDVMDYGLPPKPDHPETDKYIEFTKVLMGDKVGVLSKAHGKGGDTPLIKSAEKGSLPHVQFFIGLGVPIDDPNDLGNTALWIACAKRYPCIISELIKFRANVNWANKKGNVPLYNVCQLGPLKIAETLVAAGATMEHVNANGDTLILLCCRNGQAEILKFFIEMVDMSFVNFKAHIDGFNAVFASVEANKVECLKVLKNYGCDINQRTDADNPILASATPLHLAAYYGRKESVEALLQMGADVDSQDQQGMTPLHIAVVRGHNETVAMLRRAGASTTLTDKNGNTAVSYCRSKPELRAFLIDPVADPLLRLCRGGFTEEEEMQVLQEIPRYAGTPGVLTVRQSIDITSEDGSTALILAVLFGRFNVVKAFAELGVDVGRSDVSGLTPSAWAHWIRNARMKSLLPPIKEGAGEESQQLQRLQSFSAGDPIDAAVLFLAGKKPPADREVSRSSLDHRMATFINQVCVKVPEWQLLLKDASSSTPHAHADPTSVKDTEALLWWAKVFTVSLIASGESQLLPREVAALNMFTSSALMPTLVHPYIQTGEFKAASPLRSFTLTMTSALLKLPPYVGEVYIGAENVHRALFAEKREVSWATFLSGTALWPNATDALQDFTKKGTIFIVHSKTTGRLVSRYSSNRSDSEVVFLPFTTFRVKRWYRGDVIALGQANIREHTFGAAASDITEKYLSSEKPLIIELEEQA